MLGKLTKTPELEISQPEAEALAVSIVKVAEFYPGIGGAVSGETMAWLALVQTVAMVYGPRVLAALDRRKRETAPRDENAPGFAGPYDPTRPQPEYRQ